MASSPWRRFCDWVRSWRRRFCNPKFHSSKRRLSLFFFVNDLKAQGFVVSTKIQGPKKKKTTTIPICIIAVSHPKVYESLFFFLKTPKFGRFQELGTSKKLRFLSLPARSREADRMASVTPERAAGVGSQWWNGYVTLDSAIYIISYYNIHLYTIIYYYMYLYVIITWD